MSMSTSSDHRSVQRAAFDTWVDVWNGDYTGAHRVVSPDFRIHAALLDGSDDGAIRGADGLVEWIGQIRGAMPDLRFAAEVGPLVDGDFVAARWTATGTYAGGFPGARAEPGTVVTWTGTDILRTEHGQIVEYWLNADSLPLLAQLKAL
ncbi:ester cyclase [Streptomyces niveus]|uniref:ester cyclase n=1 Tax=Streptomyces niveus TaxID=193462 RepID=UPI0036D2F343